MSVDPQCASISSDGPLTGGRDRKRFLRFCVVGGANFVASFVTFNVSWLLLHNFPLCTLLGYIASITNSFLLNRAWTFRDRRGEPATGQAAKFVIVSVGGFILNLLLTAFIVAMVMSAGRGGPVWLRVGGVLADLMTSGGRQHYSLLVLNLAGIAVTGVMLVWNYLGSLLWSFRK